MMSVNYNSPEDITQKGEQLYFSQLQSQLEPLHNGEYVVIEVESGDHFVDKDMLTALNAARAKYPTKMFYIASIGSIRKPTTNYQYAWHFS